MEGSFQITEDSRSLMQYFKPNKAQVMKEKKQMKAQQNIRKRKNSTQLSLFGWLTKTRPKQTSELYSVLYLRAQLSPDLMVHIFSYLRLSEIIIMSRTCFSFYECSRSIWSDRQFFKQLQTDKLSEGQLRNILERGGKMSHIRQLRNIYMGKNLKSCRQKIKVKVHDTTSNMLKSNGGNLLQIFQVSTKTHKASAFLMDNHLQEIINSSFRSLICIKLQSCRFIRKFYDLSKCLQLKSLIITDNSYLSNQDMRVITKCCCKIQVLDLSGCDSLDQGIFKHISKLTNLKTLSMNGYQQPFGDLQCMSPLTDLTCLSLQNSCIMDIQGIQFLKELESLKLFKINGCQLLTDLFLKSAIILDKKKQLILQLNKTKFSPEVLQNWLNHKNKINQKLN